MTTRTHVAVFTAIAAISLAFSAQAIAGPAGSEYLPSFPKGSGKPQNEGTTSTAAGSANYTVGSSSGEASGGTSSGGGKGTGKANHKHPANAAPTPAPVKGIAPASEGSGGTPWVPLGVLIVAGTATLAAGLLLRRRTT